jgi:hypothetical protein
VAAVVGGIAELERGREAFARRAWLDAYTSLSRADQATPLGPEDLELLATSVYMLGRDDEWMRGIGVTEPATCPPRCETQCCAPSANGSSARITDLCSQRPRHQRADEKCADNRTPELSLRS